MDIRCLRDESAAQDYKRKLAESLRELNDSDDPENVWTKQNCADFKTKIVQVSESSTRDTHETSNNPLTKMP